MRRQSWPPSSRVSGWRTGHILPRTVHCNGAPPANAGLLSPLTVRELELLTLLDKRYTDQEIADTLVISLPTVRSHVVHIGDKLGAHRRRAIVQAAREQGLL